MKRYILSTAFMLISTFAMAGGNPGLPGEDPDVPIDGGIGLLLLAGAAYGVKKIRDRNK